MYIPTIECPIMKHGIVGYSFVITSAKAMISFTYVSNVSTCTLSPSLLPCPTVE